MMRHPFRLSAVWLACMVLLWSVGGAAAQGTVAPVIKHQFLDNDGEPCSGCFLHVYAAGTTTEVDSYPDNTLNPLNANENPVELDSAGRAAIFLGPGSYRFILADADDNTIWDADGVSSVPATTINTDIEGVAGEAISEGDVVFLADGSGGSTAGRWYKASNSAARTSTAPGIVGIATEDVANAGTGSIRIAGRMTGLAGLTVGGTHWVGSTAGTLTATQPANARFIGVADSTTTIAIQPNPVLPTLPLNIAEGRLTATTGIACTVSDVSGATSIYYTPVKGNRIELYDGASWNVRTFTEITISVLGLIASRPYDVFLYDNASVVTAELTAWNNATSRNTSIERLNGVWVKNGAATRRYVGTIRINGSGGQLDDTATSRSIYNEHNKCPRSLLKLDTTDNWTYTTATYRQANGSATNTVGVMIGVQDVRLRLGVRAYASNSSADIAIAVSIGDGSTTTAATGVLGMNGWTQTANGVNPLSADLDVVPTVGWHDYNWIEWSTAGGTTTWYGDKGSPGQLQSGLFGSIEM